MVIALGLCMSVSGSGSASSLSPPEKASFHEVKANDANVSFDVTVMHDYAYTLPSGKLVDAFSIITVTNPETVFATTEPKTIYLKPLYLVEKWEPGRRGSLSGDNVHKPNSSFTYCRKLTFERARNGIMSPSSNSLS